MKLELNGIQFSYGVRDIVKDICFHVDDGEIISLVGPNGSGKTTILRCINRILKPQHGEILLNGIDVKTMNAMELARIFGYVPQSSPASFPLTVFDMVLLGRKPHMGWKVSSVDRDTVFGIIQLMGLEDMAFRIFNELSGGEKQRVLVARALVQEPQVLLFDEPISNLDLRYQFEILDIIATEVRKKGLAAVIAMHDLNLASRFSDRVVMLKGGRIFTDGCCHDVFNKDNIREVYGVEVAVYNTSNRTQIVPVSSIDKIKNSAEAGLESTCLPVREDKY
jgi:iron complex transport system ATP-binding protein